MGKQITCLIFMITITVAGFAQADSQLDSALFVEALINHYDAAPKTAYLPGYRFDRTFRQREFHHPVTVIPLELHYGVGFYGGAGQNNNSMPGNWISYEQPVAELSSVQTQRIYHRLDLDLLKINLSNYILGASWADINTGINLSYSTMFGAPDLPAGPWGNVQASWNVGEKQFSPRILGIGISNSMISQWSDWWFVNLRYTYGVASAKFYQDGESGYDPAPSGWGPAVGYDLGVRFILDPGEKIRYSFGFDLHHDYTKINRIDDPGDVTPISRFTMTGYGLFLTLSAYYGGKLSMGDLGKKYYYRRDYVTAREKLSDFLERNPQHANRRRAIKLIDRCNLNIPEQYYREGRRFEAEDRPEKALERYRMAEVNADSNLILVIYAAYERLAENPLARAAELSDLDQVQAALDMVTATADYSRTGRQLVPAYQARAAIFRGKAAMKYGFYSKALEQYNLAMELDPSLGVEIKQLRYQVAAALIGEANEVEDLAAVQLAIQSLEQAEELMGGLGKTSAEILEQLKERLSIYEAGRIQIQIDKRMTAARERLRRDQVYAQVGMTVPEIQALLGEPNEIVYKSNSGGVDYQLWIYQLNDADILELSFQDYILFKIERP